MTLRHRTQHTGVSRTLRCDTHTHAHKHKGYPATQPGPCTRFVAPGERAHTLLLVSPIFVSVPQFAGVSDTTASVQHVCLCVTGVCACVCVPPVQNLFNELDVDRSGSVSLDELSNGLKKQGYILMDHELEQLVSH